MRDHDRPDVATAILDRLIGRQIESRAWPAPPADRPAPPDDRPAQGAPDSPGADGVDTDPDAFGENSRTASPAEREDGVGAEADDVPDDVGASDHGTLPTEALAFELPGSTEASVTASPEAFMTPSAPEDAEPVPPADAPPDDPTEAYLEVADDLAGTLADAEALALRSLLSECATLLQWVCTKAEQGTLSHGDVARARAFVAMSGLPPAPGRAES